MKRILLALLLLPSLCLGAANDFGMSQRSAADNSWVMRLMSSPSTPGVMVYDPATKLTVWNTLGSGLSVSDGVINATASAGTQGPKGDTGPVGPVGATGAAAPTPVPGAVTRALNTAFQPNAARPALVSYNVDISVVSLLLAGTQGTVTLQYADNAAMTTNLVTVASATNSTGGVLNVANIGTAALVGFIPAGKYVRILTANTAGSPTFTFRNGQETIF